MSKIHLYFVPTPESQHVEFIKTGQTFDIVSVGLRPGNNTEKEVSGDTWIKLLTLAKWSPRHSLYQFAMGFNVDLLRPAQAGWTTSEPLPDDVPTFSSLQHVIQHLEIELYDMEMTPHMHNLQGLLPELGPQKAPPDYGSAGWLRVRG